MSTGNAIEVENLTRRFKELVAVDHIDFEVPQGEVFGFLGPNGAGKTTTISMLTTLLKPTEGRARVAGHDIRSAGAAVRNGRVYVLDDNLVSRPGPRVVEGVRQIAEALHPEAFE